jgi:DNA repair protein RadC
MSTRVTDIPEKQRPREKLIQYGPSALANAELLALFLGTGSKGRSAIDIAQHLIQKYGGLGPLGSLSASALAMEPGIGEAKASILVAAYELGSRVAREQINAAPLDCPDLIYNHFAAQLQSLPHEQVLVVSLDTRLRHTGTTVVSIGTVNEAAAHPREILRPIITRNAYAFILIHNHPSGDPTPSRADYRITENLVKAADLMQIRLIDHVIIGRPSPGNQPYFSFREAGVVAG